MNIPNARIANLHQVYEQITGLQLPLNKAFSREYAWSLWLANGWTEADLRLVVAHLKRSYKDFWLKMVKFSRLIEDRASFEEWLAEARASQRNQRSAPTQKAAVMAATGRKEPCAQELPAERRADEISEELWKDGFSKLREETGLI
jgi:hypothetical protein